MRTTNKCAGRTNGVAAGSSDVKDVVAAASNSSCAVNDANGIKLIATDGTSPNAHKKSAARIAVSCLLQNAKKLNAVCVPAGNDSEISASSDFPRIWRSINLGRGQWERLHADQ